MSNKTIAVLGLGYVGLPLALALSRKQPTLGFDVSAERIEQLQRGEDISGEVARDELAGAALDLSSDPASLFGRDIFIVTVPTPIDLDRRPDLHPLGAASGMIGEALTPGTAYVAPAGIHLRIVRRNGGLEARLDAEPAGSAHRPSVDELFLSAAHEVGRRAIGILLTGMGRDGAEGMEAMAAAGARTMVQDQETSVVFGMPRAALERGVAHEVLPLDEVGERARRLLEGEH